jgi:hypothetical protein
MFALDYHSFLLPFSLKNAAVLPEVGKGGVKVDKGNWI